MKEQLTRRMFIQKAGLLSLIPFVPSSLFVGYKIQKPLLALNDKEKKEILFLGQFKKALRRRGFNPGMNCIVELRYAPEFLAYFLVTSGTLYGEDYYAGDYVDIDFHLSNPEEINRLAEDHVLAFKRAKRRINDRPTPK